MPEFTSTKKNDPLARAASPQIAEQNAAQATSDFEQASQMQFSPTPGSILRMQRTSGNQAVMRYLAQRTSYLEDIRSDYSSSAPMTGQPVTSPSSGGSYLPSGPAPVTGQPVSSPGTPSSSLPATGPRTGTPVVAPPTNSPPAQSPAPPSEVPADQQDTADERVAAARKMVAELKSIGTKYGQPETRDWSDKTVADCSKFVQWLLEAAGQDNMMGGREGATTAQMQQWIMDATDTEKVQDAFRTDSPQPGDVMMWEHHVGLVVAVAQEGDTQYMAFAAMGSSGASIIGEKDGKLWLKVKDTDQIDTFGSGAFLGYWTP